MPMSQFPLNFCPLYSHLSLCIPLFPTDNTWRRGSDLKTWQEGEVKHKFNRDILGFRVDPWQFGNMSHKTAGDTYLMWVVDFEFREPQSLDTSVGHLMQMATPCMGIRAEWGFWKLERFSEYWFAWTSETWQVLQEPIYGCLRLWKYGVEVYRCNWGCWNQALTALGRLS